MKTTAIAMTESGYMAVRTPKLKVIVMGDSLLQGTEAPVCLPDQSPREVCCLLGTRVQEIVEGLWKLVRPSD